MNVLNIFVFQFFHNLLVALPVLYSFISPSVSIFKARLVARFVELLLVMANVLK